jgi:MFS-type transporter involved in bile tolerance (Atg22 family)
VSTAYAPEQWHDLFVAVAGASAALAGLLFVAVSINVERIVKYEGLPERGIEALAMLLVPLIVSIAALLPGQGHLVLGIELLAIAVALIGVMMSLPVAPRLPDGIETPPRYLLSRQAVRLSGTVLLLIGALAELFAVAGGLYWVAGAIVVLILGAVINAWVLLVEILR